MKNVTLVNTPKSRMIRLIGRYTSILIALCGAGWCMANDGCQVQTHESIQSRADVEPMVDNQPHQLEKNLAKVERSKSAETGLATSVEREADQVVWEILHLATTDQIDKAKIKIKEFRKNFANTETAKKARNTFIEIETIGKHAPKNFSVEKWFQGEKDVNFASNKPTLLVFWEVWCPHCQEEVPRLEAIYSNFRNQGLQVVGMTIAAQGTTDEEIYEFLKTNNVSYPSAKNSGGLYDYFNVNDVPVAIVLKNRKVIWRGAPAYLNDDLVKSWLTRRT